MTSNFLNQESSLFLYAALDVLRIVGYAFLGVAMVLQALRRRGAYRMQRYLIGSISIGLMLGIGFGGIKYVESDATLLYRLFMTPAVWGLAMLSFYIVVREFQVIRRGGVIFEQVGRLEPDGVSEQPDSE